MNAANIPDILKDTTLFDQCAREASSHIMKQLPHIHKPIAAYGAFIAAGIPAGHERFVDFMRAMVQAKAQTWTGQLNDPLYTEHLDRLEDTIAHNVYLAYVAENRDVGKAVS